MGIACANDGEIVLTADIVQPKTKRQDIAISGKTEHIFGKKELNDEAWTDVTTFTDEQKKDYHFFKIEMQ